VRPTQIRWLVFRDREEIGADLPTGKQVGWLSTQVKRADDRTFLLSSELEFSTLRLAPAVEFNQLRRLLKSEVRGQIKLLHGKYRVSAHGKLRSFSSDVVINLGPANQARTVQVAIAGEVRQGRCLPRIYVNELIPAGELSAFEIHARGGIINPTHPLHRIPELLAEGQRWQIPLVVPPVIPLADLGTPFVSTADAHVSAGVVRWGGADEDCWMIDYRLARKAAIIARTCVRQSDQRVLRQEAIFQGSRLVMVRGPINH
jgi:hypothetical protein